MASTILYKFRSGTTFEALPLPGSAARLFDVKKAIVKAKKLDSGSMEFDLAVRNADTNEEYANESMVLPRGTRLIVQRLPAARGHGFLARMARNEHAGVVGLPGNSSHHAGSAPSGFYTIDSRSRDDDDEFVQSGEGDEEKELAALQAVTNMQPSGPAMAGGYSGPQRGGPPQGGHRGQGGMQGNAQKSSYRPNADPELREQEKQLLPKKRATGIPRTFLNLKAPPQTDGTKDGEGESLPILQPNTLGFKELVNRGGGQSENTAGTRRDLDYALKLTATTVPEHLQCGICNGVVKNSMLLPWDPEGRTACETCIRDALTQNGFRCPLTGQDAVSPDDLIPNVGLRKAADLFIKGVMEKVDEIEKQQVDDAEMNDEVDTGKSVNNNILDGDGVEKGVLVSKKMVMASRKKDDDDPFGGGDDEFGGDVFAVESEKHKEEEETPEEKEEQKETSETKEETADTNTNKENDNTNHDKDVVPEEPKNITEQPNNGNEKDLTVSTETRNAGTDSPDKHHETPTQTRRDHRSRRPPAGYAMGPAGGAVGASQARNAPQDEHVDRGFQGGRGRGHSPSAGRRGGGFHGYQDRDSQRGRGRGRFGPGRGGFDRNGGDHHDDRSHSDEGSRGTKRPFDEHASEGHRDQSPHSRYDRHDDRGGRGPPRDLRSDGRGPPPGGFRGRGGGRPWGRGGGGRGGEGRGEGGFRGGRGRGGYGRGRY